MSRPRLLLLAVLAAQALQPVCLTAQGQPTFRTGVTLLTLDVSVIDDDWRPVPGLTAQDFEVDLDGRRQPVRTVDYQTFDPNRPLEEFRRPSATTVGGAAASAAAPQAKVQDRTFLLLVDDLSFTPLEHKSLAMAAQRFVAALRQTDRLGLVTTSGRHTVAPSWDRRPVTAALDAVQGMFSSPQRDASVSCRAHRIEGEQIALSEAIRIGRNDVGTLRAVVEREIGDDSCEPEVQFLAGLLARALENTYDRQARGWAAAARALSGGSGSKVMVVLSGGLPAEISMGPMRPFASAVTKSGIALHVLGEVRAESSAEDRMFADSRGTGGQRRRQDSAMFLDGLRDATAWAGGLFQPAIGTSDDSFARILAASAAKYRLGVELPAGTSPGAVLRTRVRVRRRGSRVTVASEYTTPGPAPVLSTEDQLRAVVSQGASFYDLPVTLTPLVRRHPDGTALELGLHVAVPATARLPLDVMFAVVSESGRVAQSGRTRIERTAGGETHPFAFSVAVPPGNYRVRMAVADASANVGSHEQAVTVRLTRMGGLLAGHLVARAVGPQSSSVVLSSESVPESATQLEVGVELYRDAASSADVVRVARVELLDDQGAAMVEQDVPLPAGESAWFAGIRIPLQTLPPGRYAMAVELVEGGTAVGRVSRGLSKTAPVASLETLGAPSLPSASSEPDSSLPASVPPPRHLTGVPPAETVLAVLRRDAAAYRPAPDVSRLLDKAAVVAHLASVPGSAPPESSPAPTLDDAAFWPALANFADRASGARADFARGVVALQRADWAAAVASLERSLESVPDALIAMRYLGAASAGIGEDRDAAGAWALALDAAEATPEWQLAYANVLVRAQDPAAAVAALDAAIARWPEDGRLLGRRGELRLAAGRLDEARIDLVRAGTLAPADARTAFLLAALAYVDVAAGASATALAEFDRRSAHYLTLIGDSPSPVNDWRRLVALAAKPQ